MGLVEEEYEGDVVIKIKFCSDQDRKKL